MMYGAALPIALTVGYLLMALWRRAALGWFLFGGAVTCMVLWVVFMIGAVFTPWDPVIAVEPHWWEGVVAFSWANSITGLACLGVLLSITLLAHLAGSVLGRRSAAL